MKIRKTLLLLSISVFFFNSAFSQNGVILMDSLNLKVVKVWGTHEQRGYAYGYLCGAGMSQIINSYVKPIFGTNYTTARNLIIAGNDLAIDARFQMEAQGIIDGMNAAGTNTTGLDATDILVGNCLLDLMGIMGMKSDMGCSSLMSWGDATLGTPLMGKSVIARHLDWQSNNSLLNNQVLLIQQPVETDEQNWAMIGFEGMISALSGFNNSMGTFQHVMDDYTNAGSQHNQHYKPVWFAMRQALELSDYDNDGVCNVQDVEASLLDSPNGFADGYIVSALSENFNVDSLTAVVAELAPQEPRITFRSNSFPDSIPGDNLYTANYQIARNNAMHFCSRYIGITNHIGNGTMIGLQENWNLMRDYSHLTNNVQFMQYSPEEHHLQIALRQSQPAYLCESMVLNTDQLLNTVVGVPDDKALSALSVFPNPVTNYLHIAGLNQIKGLQKLEIIDVLGIIKWSMPGSENINFSNISTSNWNSSVYFIRVYTDEGSTTLRFIKE